MNNNQNNNNCYVFSRATLDQAIQEWVVIKSKKDAKNEEKYLITAKALPWFLNHFNHNSSIYSFSEEDLESELKEWKSTQIENYPKQKKRIEETCKHILNFFQSDLIEQYKMTINT